MPKLDLDKLSVEELQQLKRDASKAIASYEDRRRAEVVAELEAVAKKHGYKLSDLVGGKKAALLSFSTQPSRAPKSILMLGDRSMIVCAPHPR